MSPRAKHMLLSIALIQMQRGGIIARVAVASQGLCPSLAPVSQAHAISISSLPLCIKPQTFYQTRPSRFISTQHTSFKKSVSVFFFFFFFFFKSQHRPPPTPPPPPRVVCCCQVIIFGAPSSLILTVQHVGRVYWQNGGMSNDCTNGR